MNSIFCLRFTAENQGFLNEGATDFFKMFNQRILIHRTLVNPFKGVKVDYNLTDFLRNTAKCCVFSLSVFNHKHCHFYFDKIIDHKPAKKSHQFISVKNNKLMFDKRNIRLQITPYFFEKENRP